jgi:hypothetical protein
MTIFVITLILSIGKVRRKDKNTDIITKGATKLYEERMGPDTAVWIVTAVKRGVKDYGVSTPDDIDQPINMKKGMENSLLRF